MDKMNSFDDRNKDREYEKMGERLNAGLLLTGKEKLLMSLHYLCGEVTEYIHLEEGKELDLVLPSLSEHGCAIKIEIKGEEPLLIHLIGETGTRSHHLFFTKDFTSRGIINGDFIIKHLNDKLPNFTFMLDVDTKEN